MLLPFSIRVAEWPPVWERAVHSANYACVLSPGRLSKCCRCPSFPFGIEGRMWDVMVLIADPCLSVYLSVIYLCSAVIYNEFC